MKRRIPLTVALAGLIVSALGLFLMLNLTSPFKAGSFGILVVFALVYIMTFSVAIFLQRFLKVVYRLIIPARKTATNNEYIEALSQRRVNLIIATLSFVPIFILSMNSIGQINIFDVVLITIIEGLVIFWIMRKTAK
ncbi:MAG: hypothetical protein LBM09_02635 [Candidatus Nomurabacteria bacterium]|jgi:hypothetical protein|nr:hypothetical protein [Candidatus Nomurabacteria bacterium]